MVCSALRRVIFNVFVVLSVNRVLLARQLVVIVLFGLELRSGRTGVVEVFKWQLVRLVRHRNHPLGACWSLCSHLSVGDGSVLRLGCG